MIKSRTNKKELRVDMDKDIMKVIAYFIIVAYAIILVGSTIMYTDCMPVNVFVFIIQLCTSACIWQAYKEIKQNN